MNDLIEKILAYLPNYFVELGSLLSGPKTFIASKATSADDLFRNALIFTAITLATVNIMTASYKLPGENIWIKVARGATTASININCGTIAVLGAWRLMGYRLAPKVAFAITAYYICAAELIAAMFGLVGMGTFKLFLNPICFLDSFTKSSKVTVIC
jgi:hypothetical protein